MILEDLHLGSTVKWNRHNKECMVCELTQKGLAAIDEEGFRITIIFSELNSGECEVTGSVYCDVCNGSQVYYLDGLQHDCICTESEIPAVWDSVLKKVYQKSK